MLQEKMHKNYKVDEQVITTIRTRHIKPTEPQKQIKLIICYIKSKASNLITKNNTNTHKLPSLKLM